MKFNELIMKKKKEIKSYVNSYSFTQDYDELTKYFAKSMMNALTFGIASICVGYLFLSKNDIYEQNKIENQKIETVFSLDATSLEKKIMNIERIEHGDFNNDGIPDLKIFFKSNQDLNNKKMIEFYGINFGKDLGSFLKSHGKLELKGQKYIVTKFGLMEDNS